MILSDFAIGREFWTATGQWRCTDVGTRSIAAIKLEGDPRDWNGPPYGVAERVFDEEDVQDCAPTREAFHAEFGDWPDDAVEDPIAREIEAATFTGFTLALRVFQRANEVRVTVGEDRTWSTLREIAEGQLTIITSPAETLAKYPDARPGVAERLWSHVNAMVASDRENATRVLAHFTHIVDESERHRADEPT